MSDLFIGIMSGTSLDGVDALLARFPAEGPMEVLGFEHLAFAPSLREELLSLNTPGANEIHRSSLAANAISRCYAEAVHSLLDRTGHEAGAIRATGAHGQTIRHRPREFDGTGYTVQLLNGALLAELIGIDVVCDLRSRDLAAGGQGAPLVPAFHQALFGEAGQATAVLNIGGISNVSLLGADGQVGGFDCGPGNCLMDHWIGRHQGLPYDAGGDWASQGRVLPRLLHAMLAEPFFALAPPRSTGRDLFHPTWLNAALAAHAADAAPADVQATLLELTARSIADCLLEHGPASTRLLVCGGGALNTMLMRRLAALLPTVAVDSTEKSGLPAMQVEAAAFAWLAMRHVRRLPGSLSAVTGALGSRVLGALHPA